MERTGAMDPREPTQAQGTPGAMDTRKVVATEAALQLIEKLKSLHGPLMFHQSGGCCDGSAPMCYLLGEFKTGGQDVYLGEIDDCPFYISASQYAYWRHTQLIVDAVPGRGAGFSLESPEGMRFLSRSRVFTGAELLLVQTTTAGTAGADRHQRIGD